MHPTAALKWRSFQIQNAVVTPLVSQIHSYGQTVEIGLQIASPVFLLLGSPTPPWDSVFPSIAPPVRPIPPWFLAVLCSQTLPALWPITLLLNLVILLQGSSSLFTVIAP